MDKQKTALQILEGDVRSLKILLHTIVDTMYSLSIRSENRTEFSEELQEEIVAWKEEIDII
jgi:hypothetical protein